MRKSSPQHGHEIPEHENDHGEVMSEVAEKTQEFIEKALEDSDDHVIHCPKCYQAQQSEKYMKAATFFSLGAFVLSIVSIALPFLHASDVSQDQWEKLLTVLSSIQTSSSSSSQSSTTLIPSAAKPASSRSAQTGGVRSSVSSSSVVSFSEASSSSNAAAGGASSSSSSDGTGL